MNEVIDVTARKVEEPLSLPERVIELQGEIKALHRQYRELTVSYAVEIGRRLTEAKELIPHGAWGAWLRDNVAFSQRTANDLMRMFSEYGADQQGVLGAEVESQAIANLSVTQAVRLLALPEDEREEMAAQAAAQGMSTRELEAAIRERDEARKAAEEAAADKEMARKSSYEALEQLSEARKERDEALQDAKEAVAQRTEARKEREEAARELKDARKYSGDLETKWAEAKKKLQELEKKLADEGTPKEKTASPDPETVRALEEARAEAERLKKELKASDADVAAFRVYFEGLQTQTGKIAELLSHMEPAKADKLRTAVRALLEKLKEEIGT